MENATESVKNEVSGYRKIHGYLCVVVCTIGVLLNSVNFLAWTRKVPAVSDTLLSTLGVSDGFSVLSYLIYSVYFFIVSEPNKNMYHSQNGMYLVMISFHAFLTFHMFSNWLTLSLAIIRYLQVCRGFTQKRMCSMKIAKFITIFGVISTVLVALPFYFYYEIYDLNVESTNLSGFWIRKTDFTADHSHEFQIPLLWLYGVVFKLVPCTLMILLSGSMVNFLRRAKKRKDLLTNRSIYQTNRRISMEYNRTTLMLVTIVMIYVLSETPIAISAFLSGLQRSEGHFFYFLLYSAVGDILDLLTVLNASANFFVYITMCHQYRKRVKRLFRW